MGVLLLLGCLLIAFSLPVVLFVATAARRPQLLVLTAVAALAWLAAFLVTTALWSLLPSDKDDSLQNVQWPLLILGSFLQEVVRLLLLQSYTAYARSFAAVGLHALLFPLTDLYAAASMGVGFALAHSLIVYAPVLAYAGEWGALFTAGSAQTCPAFSVFPLTAFTSLLFGIFHIALMITQLDNVRRGRAERRKLSTPFSLHLMAAVAVILATQVRYGCLLSVAFLAGITAMAVGLTYSTITQTDYASRKRP